MNMSWLRHKLELLLIKKTNVPLQVINDNIIVTVLLYSIY